MLRLGLRGHVANSFYRLPLNSFYRLPGMISGWTDVPGPLFPVQGASSSLTGALSVTLVPAYPLRIDPYLDPYLICIDPYLGPLPDLDRPLLLEQR